MQEHPISSKAEDIRDVLRYVKRFQKAVIVIHLDDRLLDHSLFTSHIRDIAMLHEAGLRVVIVPGARKRIDEVLAAEGMEWRIKDGKCNAGKSEP